MKSRAILLSFALIAALSSPVSAASCYADYKAKKDQPLRLHYGVIELNQGCDKGSAQTEIAQRLSAGGWRLLNVMNVFGPEGLQERQGNAGKFYLRF